MLRPIDAAWPRRGTVFLKVKDVHERALENIRRISIGKNVLPMAFVQVMKFQWQQNPRTGYRDYLPEAQETLRNKILLQNERCEIKTPRLIEGKADEDEVCYEITWEDGYQRNVGSSTYRCMRIKIPSEFWNEDESKSVASGQRSHRSRSR